MGGREPTKPMPLITAVQGGETAVMMPQGEERGAGEWSGNRIKTTKRGKRNLSETNPGTKT